MCLSIENLVTISCITTKLVKKKSSTYMEKNHIKTLKPRKKNSNVYINKIKIVRVQ